MKTTQILKWMVKRKGVQLGIFSIRMDLYAESREVQCCGGLSVKNIVIYLLY